MLRAIHDQRAAARRVAARGRERLRNGIADDRIGLQGLRAGRAVQSKQQPGGADMDREPSQTRPP